MNLCLNLDDHDFKLNSYEQGIKKWISEIEKFYFEIKNLIEKLKNLEIKIKNNYQNFDEIKQFFAKNNIMNQESILLNFNRDYFSNLKQYLNSLQKTFLVNDNSFPPIANDFKQAEIHEELKYNIAENLELYPINESYHDPSIFIPKYYLYKINAFIRNRFFILEEIYKTPNKLYYTCTSSSKSKAVLKVINKEKSDINENHRTLATYSIIRENPHFIKLIDVKDIDDEMMILIVEYADSGNLAQFIKDNHPEGVKDTLLFHMFYQVFSGINFLHENNVCLRSLSPVNLMVSDYSLKISKFCDSIETKSLRKIDADFWRKVDIFSLGFILYYLVFAMYPFKLENKQISLSVMEIDLLINKNEKKISADLRLLLVKLLTHTEDRFTLSEIEKCKWFTNEQMKYNKTRNYLSSQSNEFLYDYLKFEK